MSILDNDTGLAKMSESLGKLKGLFLMILPGWQNRQSIREDKKLCLCQVAADDDFSSMPKCPPGSLRSVQQPLNHLVDMKDKVVSSHT